MVENIGAVAREIFGNRNDADGHGNATYDV